MTTPLIALRKGFYDPSTLGIACLRFHYSFSETLGMNKIPGHNYQPLFGLSVNL